LTNRILIGAATIELVIAALLLLVPSVAGLLGHEPPSPAGWAVALAAIPLLLVVDGIHKKVRSGVEGRHINRNEARRTTGTQEAESGVERR
jgi:hypothetical protein